MPICLNSTLTDIETALKTLAATKVKIVTARDDAPEMPDNSGRVEYYYGCLSAISMHLSTYLNSPSGVP